MKRLCTICARGGSKGVTNKNIRLLLGKPLIAHTLIQAKECGLFETIAVSSDSSAIMEVAGQWGADHLVQRPDELATDTAAKLPAILHCLQEIERRRGDNFDLLVDLDATSPLRSVDDIRGAVRLIERSGVSNIITGAPARRSPYFNLVEVDPRGVARLSKMLDWPVVRRQDAPRCYDMNASIYVWQRDVFLANPAIFYHDTLLHEMPEERSVDIDSELDFQWVEYLMRLKEKA